MSVFVSHNAGRTAFALAGSVAATLVCLVAAAGPAKVEPVNANTPHTMSVSVNDLDLGTSRAEAALEARLIG